MAYKLLDQNGYEININGMYKGTIIKNYNYDGMELYNVNSISTSVRPFYSTYRRVKIGTSYYYPSGTTKYYSTDAYEATEIVINGRYSSSSYANYEIYKDEILVSSGSYTSTATDIYTITKTANTSIIISGEWDSTNNKFIYRITTNATITRSASYAYNNHLGTYTYTVTGTGNTLTFPSLATIRSSIQSATGKTVAKLNSVKADLSSIYFHAYSAYGSYCIPYLNSVNSSTWTSPYIKGPQVSNKTSALIFTSYSAWSVMSYLSESSTTVFYGYYQDGSSSTRVYAMYPHTTGEYVYNYFCKTDSGTGNPQFTLTIEYEYE